MEMSRQNNLLKNASIGGKGGETEFEQAFSSLAYAYLKDKAPRLLDYMLGFQLIDRNEDNTKAIGVFGFQIGKQWLYAPVFFLNGDLKGHELLYIKNNDSFVPMKENWINYLMSRKPHILGEPSVGKLQELGGVAPDINSLSMSPQGNKSASDTQWLQPALPMLAAFKVKLAGSLYRGAGNRKLDQKAVIRVPFEAALTKTASNLDFNQVLPKSLALLEAAYDLAERYPTIKEATSNFYGTDCFSRWAKELRSNTIKQASSILPVPTTVTLVPTTLLGTLSQPRPITDHIKEGKLEVYMSASVVTNKDALNNSDREKLLQGKVVIKDRREDEEVSKLYTTENDISLTNPSETELYSVLEGSGEFSKMLVVLNGISSRGAESMTTVVRIDKKDGANKSWLNADSTSVFATQVSDKDEWKDWFDDLSSDTDLDEDAEYIAVNYSRSATAPFRVTTDMGEGEYKVDFRTSKDYSASRDSLMPKIQDRYAPPRRGMAAGANLISSYHSQNNSAYGATLIIGKEDKSGLRLRPVSGQLRVPASFKFIKLSDGSSSSIFGGCGCSPFDEESNPIRLGGLADIKRLLVEKTARLKIFNNGTDVYLDSVIGAVQLSKKAALCRLIDTHGLREKVAMDMLQKAEKSGHAIYRVLYAAGYGTDKQAAPNTSVLAGGPSFPLDTDTSGDRGSETYGPSTSALTRYSTEKNSPIPSMSGDESNESKWDNWQNFEAKDFKQNLQSAQTAGKDGQKEVFDVSMMAGMLKTVRQDSLVDRHLGDLMAALDSLGRLLMNFYWHQEEFEDRYGKSDLPELEDSLRNAFESLGDITLFLKEKTIESSFDKGDINLDEVSRN